MLLRAARRLLMMGVLSSGSAACEPIIVLGERFDSGVLEDAPFVDALRPDVLVSDVSVDVEASTDSPDTNPGMVIWSADHETGNLDQWSVGGEPVGGYYQWGNSALETSTEIARSGSYSVRCFIDTSSGTSHGARLYRRIEASAAYYSAWFRIAEVHSVANWWSIFLFHARDMPEPADDANFLWDLRVVQPSAGQLSIVLYEHATQRSMAASPHSLPVGQWFHLEVYLEYAPPAGSRLGVWLDGEPLLDGTGLRGEDTRPVYWIIGNGSNDLDPDSSTLFIDDAAIATGQLGP